MIRRRRALLVLVSLLAATLNPLLSAVTPISADAAIARAWTERAANLMSSTANSMDSLEEAYQALQIASEFSTPGSDALYLESMILSDGYRPEDLGIETSPLREAFRLAGESLDSAGMGQTGSDIVDFTTKASHWSSLALRLHEYGFVLDRFTDWPRGQRITPVLLYAASRAAIYMGITDKAVSWAAQGESLTVRGTDLGILGGDFGPALPAFRAIAVTGGGQNAIDTLESARRRWGTGVDDALRPWILSGRMDMNTLADIVPNLSDGMVELVEALDPIQSKSLSNDQWTTLIGENIEDLALIRRLTAMMPDDFQGRVDDKLSNFTGVLIADSDYDGYSEERIRFVSGRLDTRTIDEDQDGRLEWEITYGSGGPLRVVMDEGGLAVNYVTAAYPEVLSMVRKSDDTRFEISFLPGGLSWAPVVSAPSWELPIPPDWDESSFWNGVRSVTVDSPVDDGEAWGVATTILAGGYPIRTRELRYQDSGKVDPLWAREILYDDGLPIAGRRSWRMDSAGTWVWELYERFEGGEVVGIAWDPEMSGRPAYLRDWALERYLQTQAWDMDGDDWMDVRRFLLPDGRVSERLLMVTEARSEDLIPWKAADWAPWDR